MRVLYFFTVLVPFLSGCSPSDSGGSDGAGNSSSISVKTGCYSATYAGAQFGGVGCGILYSTGNPTVDRQSMEEYNLLNMFYSLQTQPAMYLFDECPGVKNALSMPSGYILMGYNFLVDTAVRYNTLLPYAGVMAHEWGHQIQFQKGYMPMNQSTARRTELEADAWAGYYLYAMKGWSGQNLDTFLQMLFDIGDFQYNNPSHHGTPNERRYMGLVGMQVAQYAIENHVSYTYDELHSTWMQYVSKVGNLEPSFESNHVTFLDPSRAPLLDEVYLLGVLRGERELKEYKSGGHDTLSVVPPT